MSEVDSEVKLELIFHRDTLVLDINAPDVDVSFALSMLERGKRELEQHIEVLIAQNKIAAINQANRNEQQTRKIISSLKM